ncbi:MAG: TorF family putative porin [Dysgonomonas sp.]|nr:TorF family putative porin [Dysgonomonas sp.]
MRGKKIASGLFILLFYYSTNTVLAQTKVEASISGDIVSSYVWRGFKQAGASVQPALSFSLKNFSIGAWASTDFTSNESSKKEVDFYASYSTGNLSLTLTDYWWDGEGAYRYFSSPQDGNAGHLLEAGIAYTLPAAFPLSLSCNTFVLGEGNKKANGNNSFSTYIELSYPFSVSSIDMSLSAGFIPWESAVYGSDMDSFKFTNLQLKGTKEIKITDSFSVPLFTSIIANPAAEDIHFVLGFTIK